MEQETQHSGQTGDHAGVAEPHSASAPATEGGESLNAAAGSAPDAQVTGDEPRAPENGPQESRPDTDNSTTVVAELLVKKDGKLP